MAYLKKVSSATSDAGTGDGWFKISESGLNLGSTYLSPLHFHKHGLTVVVLKLGSGQQKIW